MTDLSVLTEDLIEVPFVHHNCDASDLDCSRCMLSAVVL
jgi:hypothetical protein